jgi:hypothetical protein
MDSPTDAKHRRAEGRWRTLEAQMGILRGLREYAEGMAQVADLITKVRATDDVSAYHDLQLEVLEDLRGAETRVRVARVALGHSRPPYAISIDELQHNADARGLASVTVDLGDAEREHERHARGFNKAAQTPSLFCLRTLRITTIDVRVCCRLSTFGEALERRRIGVQLCKIQRRNIHVALTHRGGSVPQEALDAER